MTSRNQKKIHDQDSPTLTISALENTIVEYFNEKREEFRDIDKISLKKKCEK